MAGRYSVSDNDLIQEIIELRNRVSRLERTPQTNNAGVNSGGITINGGALDVRRDDLSEQGLFILGSNVTIGTSSGFELGMSAVFVRSNAVPGIFSDGGTGTIDGNEAFRVDTIDGFLSGTFASPTVKIMDKAGGNIFADSYNARQGMSDPILSTQIMPNTFSTSTSGTFSDIAVLEWYMYHPHLRIRVLVQNDAATTSEINITESGGIDSIVSVGSPGSTNAYVDLVCKRSMMRDGNSNGSPALLTLQIRRAGGAGTVHVMPISAIGIDLSYALPY